jgi:RNA polymerase sigma factor (TIGR02999 family)
MSGKQLEDVRELPVKWGNGNRAALDALMPLVYTELRHRARSYMRSEHPGHALEPTELVNEAYLRLLHQGHAGWKDRAHLIAIASEMFRRILVDHARARNRLKRSGDAMQETWAEDLHLPERAALNLAEINDALARLSIRDERQARIVELRFFAGLTIKATAGLLSVSPATVKREWNLARAWLYRELNF